MCGIFGYFDLNNKRLHQDEIELMGSLINHRGPDGTGIFSDKEQSISLGNNRLAIIDVKNGNQPFYSDNKEIVVVQNGEIFNFLELREELINKGLKFDTKSDTEVILRLYELYGVSELRKLNGMFSISIFDKRKKALYLIRDRIGEKPLYYNFQDNRLIFASEIKSILSIVKSREVDLESLNQYLTFNYVPPPRTMFKDIKQVMPGSYIRIDENNFSEVKWWELSEINSEQKKEKELKDSIYATLEDAVKIRLRSDVPFGAFLSGGIDSSSVVGLMSKNLNDPVKTFCIGFNENNFDESLFAKQAAERFHTDHYLEKVSPNLLDLWEETIYHCDQPHGDVSFMPTLRVAQLASKKVKVVLTGDGGDELFAGYDKYLNFFEKYGNGLSDIDFYSKYFENITLFNNELREELYSKATKSKINHQESENIMSTLLDKSKHFDQINKALYIDTMLLLPGNNLIKPDRMGMAVSIENRSPFLDFNMVELAFSIPGNLKLNNGESKLILKRTFESLIGKKLTYRKKQMFTVPIGNWLKTDLKDFCYDLLLSPKSRKRNLFNYIFIEKMIDKHMSGEQNYTREIRALMALELWFRVFNVECEISN